MKRALPRGGGNPNRSTRIFVARIPPTINDHQFRTYFEQFGVVQDAYMPKDATKQGRRGIGFVTFASPESVEKVCAPHQSHPAAQPPCIACLVDVVIHPTMLLLHPNHACQAHWGAAVEGRSAKAVCPIMAPQVMSISHSMNGQELAIDCATPKERSGGSAAAAASSTLSARLSKLTTAPYLTTHYPAASANGGTSAAFPDFSNASALAAALGDLGSVSTNQLASLLAAAGANLALGNGSPAHNGGAPMSPDGSDASGLTSAAGSNNNIQVRVLIESCNNGVLLHTMCCNL